MGRRTALALFSALAILAAPGAAGAATRAVEPGEQHHPRVTVADRHAPVAHVAARTASGRDRRAPHHASSSFAILDGARGPASASAWTHLALPGTSADVALASSARPRAPPAVV